MKVFLIILMMAIVTYLCRLLPFLFLKGRKLEGYLKNFIELVPVALLATLVIPDLVIPAEAGDYLSPSLLAGIMTFIFARYIPNLFLTVGFGMFIYWGCDFLL